MTTGISMNNGLNRNNSQQSAYQRVEAILAGHLQQSQSRDPREYSTNGYGNNNNCNRESVDQHYYGLNGGGGLMPQTAATTSTTSAEIGPSTSSTMDILNGIVSEPMVTVDCKAVEVSEGY